MYTVCIAEDEYYVQKSLEARLYELQMDLEIKGFAFTGREALELYEQYKPDIFFVDIYMPQRSGLDFIETVRKRHGESQTLFIIVSGYSDYENMRRALTANAFDYLKKPIVPSEFLKLMKNAVEELKKRESLLALESSKEPEDTGSEEREELIQQICGYIHGNYQETLNIKALADMFYLSPSYLSHYFKKKKNLSLGRYLEEVRMKKAVELLLYTELPIADIAEKVVYGDGNYFTKVFRKKYNKTPSEFRRDTSK